MPGMYYATTREFGNELAVHVFTNCVERDEWVRAGVLDDGAPAFEYGPRKAIKASDARKLFSEGAWETVGTVTTHPYCYPRGHRRGQWVFPEWLDKELNLRFSVGPREGFGHPDWTREVLYQRTSY